MSNLVLHTKANITHTDMDYSTILTIAKNIQGERSWSDLEPELIAECIYNATAGGCLDVYVVDSETKCLAGAAIIGQTFDIHVGQMAVVLAMYVWPAYRNQGVTRKILRVLKDFARAEGLRWCGYTHMVQPYTQQYRFIDLEKSHG